MLVGRIGSPANKGKQDIERKNDQCCAYNSLSNCVEVPRQTQMKKDDHSSQNRDSKRMTKRVQQAKAHAFAPGSLYARDIGNGCQVVVVEAVSKSQQSAGEQREFECRRHLW